MLRKMPLPALMSLLMLMAQPALALEIDRIEVRSQLGQPLLADIPVIAASPAELDRLHVQLASPATFARIGLARPQGVLADLQFKIVRNMRGNPVIRITSTMPVQEDFLTFLIQVDWGDGRLVREYSVSLDAPDTLESPALPLLHAPEAALSSVIMREAGPVAVPLQGSSDASAPTAPSIVVPAIPLATREPPARSSTQSQARRAETRRAATPAVLAKVDKTIDAPATPVASTPMKESTGEYGPVKSGDTLSKIAARLAGKAYSLNQSMLAVLRVNPEAFVDGNINLVKRGAILRAPQAAELSRYSAAEAMVMVRDQTSRWREGRPTKSQPAASPQSHAASISVPAPAGKAEAPHTAGPRLEIAPPANPVDLLAGSQSGIEVGATGDFLQRQLQLQAGETRASREAEVRELRTRVAELDRLQRRQRALIELKDEQLAARPSSRTAFWPWLLVALVAFPLLAWWTVRRRERLRLVPGTGFADPVTGATTSALSRGDIDRDQDTEARHQTQPPSHSPAWHSSAGSMAADQGEVNP